MLCLHLRLLPARGTSFSLLRQRKGSKRKATAGTGLASPNFPHCTRFFGRARNLRLRRFEHASPIPRKTALRSAAPAEKSTAQPLVLEKPISSFSGALIRLRIELLDMEFLAVIKRLPENFQVASIRRPTLLFARTYFAFLAAEQVLDIAAVAQQHQRGNHGNGGLPGRLLHQKHGGQRADYGGGECGQ